MTDDHRELLRDQLDRELAGLVASPQARRQLQARMAAASRRPRWRVRMSGLGSRLSVPLAAAAVAAVIAGSVLGVPALRSALWHRHVSTTPPGSTGRPLPTPSPASATTATTTSPRPTPSPARVPGNAMPAAGWLVLSVVPPSTGRGQQVTATLTVVSPGEARAVAAKAAAAAESTARALAAQVATQARAVPRSSAQPTSVAPRSVGPTTTAGSALISWGDGRREPVQVPCAAVALARKGMRLGSFTHVYARPGLYPVEVVVTCWGQSFVLQPLKVIVK